MKSDYSHITLVCDRSGSMQSIRSDAEGAVNKFIEEQKAVPGTATLLLVEFDANAGLGKDELKVAPWYHIVHNGNIADCPQYHLHPRGNTALNDAVGRAITETGEFLSAYHEDEKPEHVFFVVQTDGQENSSIDWTLDKLRDLIKEQTETWKWEFVFLGMGPDAFQGGINLGFQNVTKSAQAPMAYAASYSNTSDAIRGMRTNKVTNLNQANARVDEDGTVTPESRVTPVET